MIERHHLRLSLVSVSRGLAAGKMVSRGRASPPDLFVLSSHGRSVDGKLALQLVGARATDGEKMSSFDQFGWASDC